MQILTGLFAHGVLQRTARGGSDALITGTTSVTGRVLARVMRGRRTLAGFAGRKIGVAANGRFTSRLVGVPVGGPYTIELSIAGAEGDAIVGVTDVLVGDVWIAAGQSNMKGQGLLSGAARPHPMTRAFYMDDHWDVAKDPLHQLQTSVDPVHTTVKQVRGPIGTGPAVAFAQEMQRVTGVPQGILACALGGSKMLQWDPARKDAGGNSLYGATLRRSHKNGGRVAGVIWFQGESDADAEKAPLYTQRTEELVAALRRDLKSPRLPWVIMQISRALNWPDPASWNSVQEQQRCLPERIARLAMVPTVHLPMDDAMHTGGRSQQRLGKRAAQAMLALLRHPKAGPLPLAVKRVWMEAVPERNERGMSNVVVEFSNVAGRLQSGSRPVGFSVIDAAGRNRVFDVVLEGSRAIVRTGIPPADIGGSRVSYGSGVDPVCNITDSADRAVPVFGPLTLDNKGTHAR